MWQGNNVPANDLHNGKCMRELQTEYKRLINITLPQTFAQPVRFNHCFARIVLDWLFADCWYHHLNPKAPAYSQLNETQLKSAVERMNAWLQNPSLLIADNNASLQYRRSRKQA